MPRIRSIKPDFWCSEDLSQVSRDCRLFYIGLWNLADEHSRLRGDSRYLKGQIFPFDDDVSQDDVSKWIDELTVLGNVQKYRVGSSSYLYLPKLGLHQRLEPHKVASRLPPPPGHDQPPPLKSQVNEPPTLFDNSTVEPSESGADSSARGAEKNTLLYGTGNREEGQGRGTGNYNARSRAPTRRIRDADEDDHPPESGGQPRTPFDAFYAIYPRRVGPEAARRAWDKAIKLAPATEIIAGAVRYRDDPRRQAKDVEFTAHPATWLNQGRWADEVQPPPTAVANGRPTTRAEEKINRNLDKVAQARQERLAREAAQKQITGGIDAAR